MGTADPAAAPSRNIVRLAAIDIDDTLLGPDGRISAANASAVADLSLRGIRVVLASGRSHANMLPFHRTLGLAPGPVISAQGAVVRETSPEIPLGTVWHARPVPTALAAEVTRDGLSRGFAVQHYGIDEVYLQERTRWTDYDQTLNAQPQVLVPDLLSIAARVAVMKVIWLGDPEIVAHAVAGTRARYTGRLDVTPTGPPYLEFSDLGVHKGAALAAVAARLGVAQAETLAFGDGNNDAPMLAWAGLGVAVAHARPTATAAADLVGPDGDPETALARAVAAALERLGLADPRSVAM